MDQTTTSPRETYRDYINAILVTGTSTAGKTSSVRNLTKLGKVLYLTAEFYRSPPFRPSPNLTVIKATLPEDVREVYRQIYAGELEADYVVIDTFNKVLDNYVKTYISGAVKGKDNFQLWNGLPELADGMITSMRKSKAATICLAHRGHYVVKRSDGSVENHYGALAPGKLLNQVGLEGLFDMVLVADKIPLSKLTVENELLSVTPTEEGVGAAYTLQTLVVPNSLWDKVRTPMEMFSPEETYISNDMVNVIKRLREYYS